MKKYYKILYQDNMNTYYLDNVFSNENNAWEYIKNNNLNEGYSFYNVEQFKQTERTTK